MAAELQTAESAQGSLQTILVEPPVPPKNLICVGNRVFGHFRGCSNLTHPPLRLRSCRVMYSKGSKDKVANAASVVSPSCGRLQRKYLYGTVQDHLAVSVSLVRAAMSLDGRIKAS